MRVYHLRVKDNIISKLADKWIPNESDCRLEGAARLENSWIQGLDGQEEEKVKEEKLFFILS